MGARGGIATVLLLPLLLLLAGHPQPLSAGPPAGGESRPPSPAEREGWEILRDTAPGRAGEPAGSAVDMGDRWVQAVPARGARRLSPSWQEHGAACFGAGCLGKPREGERRLAHRGSQGGGCLAVCFSQGHTRMCCCCVGRGSEQPRGFGRRQGQPSGERHRRCPAKPGAMGREHAGPPCPCLALPRERLREQPLFSPGAGAWRQGGSWSVCRVWGTSRGCSVRLSWAPGWPVAWGEG